MVTEATLTVEGLRARAVDIGMERPVQTSGAGEVSGLLPILLPCSVPLLTTPSEREAATINGEQRGRACHQVSGFDYP